MVRTSPLVASVKTLGGEPRCQRRSLLSPEPVLRPGGISISSDALYPLSLEVSSPAAGTSEYLQDPSIRLLVDFFRTRGLEVLKQAQLVAENCLAVQVAPSTVSVIFHGLIEDLSAEALHLSALFPLGGAQRALLKGVVRVPKTGAADLESVAELIAARYET